MRRQLLLGLGGLSVWVVLLCASTAAVADDDDCLACHAPGEEMVEEAYQVDPEAWMASVHADMGFGCTDCHSDKEDYPHEESEIVLCATCHEGVAGDVAVSVHGDECCGGEAPVVDGLTGDQRFFLSWAQVWRAQIRDDALRQRLVTDPHSPAQYRINGVVRNMDAWYEAFGVGEDSNLYLPPEERVRIW